MNYRQWRSHIRRLFSPATGSASRVARRRRSRLRVESLESRTTPAVITVTTAADDSTPGNGVVSLREAMTAINAGTALADPDILGQNPGAFGSNDTINFNISGAKSLGI